MVATIGNPLSWAADAVSGTGSHLASTTGRIGGDRSEAPPVVMDLELSDISAALKAGVDDFLALRSDVIFMVVLYPVIGLMMVLMAFNANFAPYVFPMASGFALIGPVGAIGLYELSRRRENGEHPTWNDALALVGSPALGPILVLGCYLLAIFISWMIAANLIYGATMGTAPQTTVSAFLANIFTTPEGWQMVFFGIGIGFLFALLVLAISVVSFPLLLDRNVGVPVAMITSVSVFRRNPVVVSVWGLIIAMALTLGSLPAFLGLIVVMPVLGHASWHFYRRAVG